MKSPEESDRRSYINYASKVHQERIILDIMKTLEDGLTFLNQTRLYLLLHTTTTTITSTSVATPTIQAVTNVLESKKKDLIELVRLNVVHTLGILD